MNAPRLPGEPDNQRGSRPALNGRPKAAVTATELVERTTEAQGIPFHVEDPAVLRRVAAIFATVLEGGGRRGRTAA